MTAPSRLEAAAEQMGEREAADAAAVTEIEADLQSTFEEMHVAEERMSQSAPAEPSAALLKFGESIQTVVKQQKLVNAFMQKHIEAEGADAVLFPDVPDWIRFGRITGYRYRILRSIRDPDDEFELYNEGITFFGSPGASGWADKIGDVAVHYMTPRWAVFSKIFPFAEQAASREAHEDVLLLGSTTHVMLTPVCAWRVGAGGLREPSASLACLTGDGSLASRRETTVSRAPAHVLDRLYLTWGHGSSDFALETSALQPPNLQLLLSTPETTASHAKRLIGGFFRNFTSGGKPPVHEEWMRYPAVPLEPTYYATLLATASSMSEEEQRARAMIEPRATPRGDQPQNVRIDVDADPGFLNPRMSEMVMQHV